MNKVTPIALAISSILVFGAQQAVAQGEGAVEAEIFAKRYFTDSSYRTAKDGNLYGGALSYFLTDDVSLGLSYGEYSRLKAKSAVGGEKLKGNFTSLDAFYHFNDAESALRPYLSGGFGHQRIDRVGKDGKHKNATVNLGAGLKYYVTQNLFARAGVEALYGLDTHQAEWQAGLAAGLNFGGSSTAKQEVQEVAEVVEEPVEQPVVVPAEYARLKLEVHFDVNKATISSQEHQDIEKLAKFMQEFPQTSTVIEGHTDSTGPAAYNQKLSEQRAEAVRQVLLQEYGIEADRVKAVGFGGDQPIADNDTATGREQNRRVEASVEARIN